MGAFSKLLPTIVVCYGIQVLGALYAIPAQDELFYDLFGCLTFLSAAGWSLYGPAIKAVYWDRLPAATLPPITAFAPRQIIMTAGLALWSVRLGSFLFQVCNLDLVSISLDLKLLLLARFEERRRLSLQ